MYLYDTKKEVECNLSQLLLFFTREWLDRRGLTWS